MIPGALKIANWLASYLLGFLTGNGILTSANPEILKGGGTLQISFLKGGTIQILMSIKGLF